MIVSESMQTKTKLMMVYSKAKELEDQSAIPFLKVPPQMMRQIAKYISWTNFLSATKWLVPLSKDTILYSLIMNFKTFTNPLIIINEL